MEYLISGLIILFVINIFMFLVLLFRRIKNKKTSERNQVKEIVYKDYIEKFIAGKNEKIIDLKTKNDQSLFRTILLEEISHSEAERRQKLSELSRKMGLIKIERKELKKRSKSRKAIAAYRLGELGAVEATEELLANINPDNPELSYIIFRSLVLLTGAEHLDRIIDYFDENDFANKMRMLDLISTIEADIYPKMEEYLDGENTLKKVLALESLANRKDTRVVPYIKKEINSHDKEIKIAALKAIINGHFLDCEEILPMIYHFHNDSAWEVRAFFINAIRPCGDNRESVAILKEMATDSHYRVRFNACEKLFELEEAGMTTLAELLHSDDQFAVDTAWSLLNREITLYHLIDTLKEYKQYEYIMSNIDNYKNSLERGHLDVRE